MNVRGREKAVCTRSHGRLVQVRETAAREDDWMHEREVWLALMKFFPRVLNHSLEFAGSGRPHQFLVMHSIRRWWQLRPFKSGIRDLERRIEIVQRSDYTDERVTLYRAIASAASFLHGGLWWGQENGERFRALLSLPSGEWSEMTRTEATDLGQKINQIHASLQAEQGDPQLMFGLWFWSTMCFAMALQDLRPSGFRIWTMICGSAQSTVDHERRQIIEHFGAHHPRAQIPLDTACAHRPRYFESY